jgi:hypothetical protein
LAQPENEEPKMSISRIPTNDLDERSAPSGLTNEVCLKCAEVTKHIHGDCIPCIDADASPDFDKITEAKWNPNAVAAAELDRRHQVRIWRSGQQLLQYTGDTIVPVFVSLDFEEWRESLDYLPGMAGAPTTKIAEQAMIDRYMEERGRHLMEATPDHIQKWLTT